jgi:hypothetical protein
MRTRSEVPPKPKKPTRQPNKTDWPIDEVDKLITLTTEDGNCWTKIAKDLNNKTVDQIKNQIKSLIKTGLRVVESYRKKLKPPHNKGTTIRVQFIKSLTPCFWPTTK